MVWKEIVYNGVEIKVDEDKKQAFLRNTNIKHGIKNAGEIVDIKEARRRIESGEYCNDYFYDKMIEIVRRIANYNEGCDVCIDKCNKHGDTLFLQVFNEGGNDCTTCCLKCASELLQLYNLQQFPKGLQIINGLKNVRKQLRRLSLWTIFLKLVRRMR